MGLLGDGNNGSVVDSTAFLDSDIPQRFARLVAMGLLVAVGTTRDRGAISIQVTHNGDWDREYFRRSDDAIEWLDRIVKAAEAAGLGEQGDLPSPQKPRRGRSRLS